MEEAETSVTEALLKTHAVSSTTCYLHTVLSFPVSKPMRNKANRPTVTSTQDEKFRLHSAMKGRLCCR